MCRTILILAFLLGLTRVAPALETRDVPLADGFDIPVGKNGKSYYKSRGVRPNGHLGEDWNGVGGGDTDLGDPIYASADGIVTFAQDYRLGWGNVVIIRSAYLENGDTKFVDSLYGHLLNFNVKVGQVVKRGQLIAAMGNNRGMYEAHLHFEMRKNINVGMYRSSFPRDWSVYWSPSDFVADHRTCSGGGRIAAVPINTYPSSPPPVLASTKVYTPMQSISQAMAKGETVTGGRAIPTSPLRRTYVAAANIAASRSRTPATSAASTISSSSGASSGSAYSSSNPASSNGATSSSTSVKPAANSTTASSTSVKPVASSATASSTSAKPVAAASTATAPRTTRVTTTKAPARVATGPPPAPAATPVPTARPPITAEKRKTPVHHPLFRVDRFEDMKVLGYE